jgi:nicotinamide mononucleotide (NMN) deamidase PncC
MVDFDQNRTVTCTSEPRVERLAASLLPDCSMAATASVLAVIAPRGLEIQKMAGTIWM